MSGEIWTATTTMRFLTLTKTRPETTHPNHFLNLPFEIRQPILRQCLPDWGLSACPCLTESTGVPPPTRCDGTRKDSTCYQSRLPRRPFNWNLNLLLVCRQLSVEMQTLMAALNRDRDSVFTAVQFCGGCCAQRLLPTLPIHVRARLRIIRTWDGDIDFFGAWPWPMYQPIHDCITASLGIGSPGFLLSVDSHSQIFITPGTGAKRELTTRVLNWSTTTTTTNTTADDADDNDDNNNNTPPEDQREQEMKRVRSIRRRKRRKMKRKKFAIRYLTLASSPLWAPVAAIFLCVRCLTGGGGGGSSNRR